MVLVFLAGTFDRNKTVDDLYFLKIDLTNLTLGTTTVVAGNADNSTLLRGALQAAKQTLGMKDFYTIYLRSYCSWNGNDVYANCTDPKAYFWFNPIKIWGLNNTGVPVDTYLPKTFTDGLDAYHAASKAIFYLYVGALSAAAITLLVGISAAFSRWGSFFTTFCASAMAVLLIAASATASAVYLVLKGALNETLKKDYGIDSSIGSHVFALTWIGTAFAVGAGFFWLLSVCCCSGRSPYNPGSKEARRTRAEKTPYTYERVGSPYMGPSDHQSMPLNTLGPQGYAPQRPGQMGSAYEPFRPQGV
jgi:succinate dehydrogenase/fumarate reductase cytochrome b subunit